ncbi:MULTISPECIES: fluoride efflux transporter CrcB [unclassified Frankia]|uniref:fluoride efflux transporter CrcB n=1 Tax=unclassified Frankia TaxID=2632575 RepID=UPI002023E5CC
MDSTPSRKVVKSADPGVDSYIPAPHPKPRQGLFLLLTVISLGGAAGACARYAASLLWPAPAGAFPWTTVLVNTTGCAAIGLLMAAITELPAAHPLLRPFLGTGVLGGYTTFSTYAVDAERLVDAGRAGTALAYLTSTAALALGAVWLASTAGRSLTVRWNGR